MRDILFLSDDDGREVKTEVVSSHFSFEELSLRGISCET